MQIEMDEDFMVSQRQVAAACGVSQQYVNQLVRRGKIKAKANGRIRPADLIDEMIVSDARKKLNKADFESWFKHFRIQRERDGYGHVLGQILEALPKKALAKIIGPLNYDNLRAELVSKDDGD